MHACGLRHRTGMSFVAFKQDIFLNTKENDIAVQMLVGDDRETQVHASWTSQRENPEGTCVVARTRACRILTFPPLIYIAE